MGEEGSLGEKSPEVLVNGCDSSLCICYLFPASCFMKSVSPPFFPGFVGSALFEELEAAVAAVFELP